jgi:DNA polymerase II small subunit
MNITKYDENKDSFDSVIDEVKKPVNPVVLIEKNELSKPIVLKNYKDKDIKITVQTFVDHYRVRYKFLRKILQSRQDLSDAISIDRIKNRRKGDKISTIGLIYSKDYTKNKHVLLELEDITGSLKCIIMNNKEELFNLSKDLVCDEVIGIKGTVADGLVFIDEVYFPDVPLDEPIKKGQNDENVAFISDVQIGSKKFLRKSFMKFIKWINGNEGTLKQKKEALKIKYLFVVGDVVDGVGIYPGQESDLEIKDISDQYSECAKLFSKIRKDIQIIFSPGNHDAVRLAEPQPVFEKSLSEDLWKMENVTMVTNPALVNVCATKNFEGLDVLMYHGFSFDFYVNQLDNIRNKGGYDNICGLMKLLLQKRHMAPSHNSNLSIIDPEEDYMIIDKVPDIFVTGHVHKAKLGQYGKTTLISSSCWQDKTEYEEKLGHSPEPGRVAIINVKTRETKFMKFLVEDE